MKELGAIRFKRKGTDGRDIPFTTYGNTIVHCVKKTKITGGLLMSLERKSP